MARVSLEAVSKHYANDIRAVSELDLEVRDGEFLVLVGPSGCGKTTALRLVAGFEQITSGVVRIGERIVNSLTPKEREVAMVFQNYALYPHLTVAENIGLGLKLRKVRKQVRGERVRAAADILGLGEHLDRKPAQLSGGQRQRVAMGRALVREPDVFLMDEPLSNLDARLRIEMRVEIARVHRRLGVATLYVTHDQAEAMTMGDRVAVMRAGVLEQCDSPQAVYERPANLFVAAFIGSPPMNLYEARLTRTANGPVAAIGDQVLALPTPSSALLRYDERRVVIGIRPEALRLSRPDQDRDATLRVSVELVEALGPELLVHFSGPAPRIVPHETTAAPVTTPHGIAKAASRTPVTAGQDLTLTVDRSRLSFFDPETGLAIA